jgi:outer membrane protein assembly factor BamD
MFRAKLSVPSWIALSAAALLAAGCSSTTVDKTANWSPNRIYAEAKDEAGSGAYDKAVPLYEKLEGRAAGTPLAQQAQLEKAYAQYKAGEKANAIATIDRFLKLHPASPALDYALYLKGVINFNDDLGMFAFLTRQDLSERDQKAAKESFESFKELATRFPDSRYTPDARQRMNYIVNSLAQYEVHVARYYYSRGAYLAAIARRSPVHHRPLLRCARHEGPARRCPARADHQLPAKRVPGTRLQGQGRSVVEGLVIR